MIRKCFVAAFLAVLFSSRYAVAEGLTQQQGDEILKDLRQIRLLLERQQRPSQQPQQPLAEKVKLRLPSTTFFGKADAPVIIVEFTDYQCPFCNRFERDTLPELLKKYVDSGKVKFIPLDLPLDFHKSAFKAALATRCAGDQGKYREYREIMVKDPKGIEEGNFTGKARDVGLNEKEFQACLDDQRHAPRIREIMEIARGVGITGTPSFVIAPAGDVIDGVKIVGAMPLQVFEEKIRELLPAGSK